jgi:hypothetical protein
MTTRMRMEQQTLRKLQGLVMTLLQSLEETSRMKKLRPN